MLLWQRQQQTRRNIRGCRKSTKQEPLSPTGMARKVCSFLAARYFPLFFFLLSSIQFSFFYRISPNTTLNIKTLSNHGLWMYTPEQNLVFAFRVTESTANLGSLTVVLIIPLFSKPVCDARTFWKYYGKLTKRTTNTCMTKTTNASFLFFFCLILLLGLVPNKRMGYMHHFCAVLNVICLYQEHARVTRKEITCPLDVGPSKQ